MERAEIAEDPEIDDETFHACLIDAMLTVEFEPPDGDDRVEIRYPFIFRPGGMQGDGEAVVVLGG